MPYYHCLTRAALQNLMIHSITLHLTAIPTRSQSGSVANSRSALHFLAYSIDKHPVYFKIFAAYQQLRCHPRTVLQNPQRLSRLCTAVKICHIQRLVDMQFSFLPVLSYAVVIIQPIGQVRAFLDFCNERTCPNGMDRACRDKKQVILVNRYILQILHHRALSFLSVVFSILFTAPAQTSAYRER